VGGVAFGDVLGGEDVQRSRIYGKTLIYARKPTS
jgi:hypothetical protein